MYQAKQSNKKLKAKENQNQKHTKVILRKISFPDFGVQQHIHVICMYGMYSAFSVQTFVN